MCELIPSRPQRFPTAPLRISYRGTTVDQDWHVRLAALTKASDDHVIVQCLEPEGWEDLPWPTDNEQVLVPKGTRLRRVDRPAAPAPT